MTPPRQTAEHHFELVIRLQPSRSNQPADGALRLRAQALVKDILMSRLEVDPEINAHGYVHTQGFTDLGRALAASRALQFAFEGFRNAVPSPPANIAVVLDSSTPEEAATEQAGPSVEQKELLASAKPSQVLITQAFYDRIADSQPALRSSPRAGIYEYLWTSEQRLDKLQAEAEFVPTLVSGVIQPPALADTVVQRPVKTAVEPARREPPRPPAPQPQPRPRPRPEPAVADRESPQRLSGKRVFAVCSVVAALIVIGYLIISNFVSKPAKPVAQRTSPAHPALSTQAPPPTAPPNPVAQAAPPVVPPDTKRISPAPPPKSKSKFEAADEDAPAQTSSKQATKGHDCAIAGEVPEELKLADGYSSQGKYERAITAYQQVLACEPGNRQAQTGLRNAQTAEKYSTQ
jgi:tetratricopeptide (TPR) repeat protein